MRIICSRFARRGVAAMASIDGSIPIRAWLLDRWDEMRLRAFLHGPITQMADSQA